MRTEVAFYELRGRRHRVAVPRVLAGGFQRRVVDGDHLLRSHLEGNVLLAEPDGRPEISGIIDGERAFWALPDLPRPDHAGGGDTTRLRPGRA